MAVRGPVAGVASAASKHAQSHREEAETVKMCEDFAPNFDDKITGCCITTTHRLTLPFSPGNFVTKNSMTVIPNPPCFSLFPRFKIKLRGRHFDTIEVTEAESQVMLNTLTENYFQIAFKNCRSAGNGAYVWKGTTSRVIVASRLIVSFSTRWQHQSRKLSVCMFA
jgi:hypothetical protein